MRRIRGACIISPGGRGGVGGIQTYARTVAARLEADHPGRPVAVLDPRGPSAWLWPLWTAAALVRLAALAAAGRADVVHLQASERCSLLRKGLLAAAARALGLRTILHHHGAELIPCARALPGPARRALAAAVRRADGNVVLGAVWARFLVDELGADPARVTVLWNGIEDASASARDRPCARPAARPMRVLFLAVMTERKGGRTLLDALALLRARGVAVEAALAGDGPDLAPCRAAALRLGLAATCTFPGRVGPAEAARLMREADVFVSPSRHEGLPISILEALRAGTPVIATPVGAIGEALPDGDGALHVPVGDAAALADRLEALAADPERRAALGRAARRAFEERFEMSRHMAALRRIYGWEGADAQIVAG